MDLHVDVDRVPWSELASSGGAEPTAAVRRRVLAARERALRRAPGRPNARLADGELTSICHTGPAGERLLATAAEQHRLSARACRRLLRVARTIADLEGSADIEDDHVLAAVRMRIPGGATPT